MTDTTTPETRTPHAIHPALAVATLVAYAIFAAFSLARTTWAQCPGGETLDRTWIYADGIITLLMGALFSAVVKAALAASGLPEDLAEKVDILIAEVQQTRSDTVSLLSRGTDLQHHDPEPHEPTSVPPLTARQVTLSNGMSVVARFQRPES